MRRPLDVIGAPSSSGLALLVGWIAWATYSARHGGSALPVTSPYVAAPAALVGGLALGHVIVSRVDSAVVVAIVLALGLWLLLSAWWTVGPTRGGLGYANANAALAVQLLGLSGLAMLWPQRASVRVGAALSALVALTVVAVNASSAGMAVALPLAAIVVVLAWRPVMSRRVVTAFAVACALVIGAAGAVIVALGATSTWPAWASSAFDWARRSLWHDAATMWRTHPGAGVGPANFEHLSALGHDPDTAAAHSSVLQVGAEIGTVGVALFALIVLAGLWWTVSGRPAYGVVAAASWTALLVHSFVDHLLDFPAVVLAAGVTVGWAAASSRRRSEELDVTQRQPPRPG